MVISTRFLVNMKCSFQDRDYLYLVLNYFEGGDLRYHLSQRSFGEAETSTILMTIRIFYSMHSTRTTVYSRFKDHPP